MRFHTLLLVVTSGAIAIALDVPAAAQHAGDLWVGRDSTFRLALSPGGFDPAEDVSAPMAEVLSSFRSVNPGFDANIVGAADIAPLRGDSNGGQARIRLVAVADLDAALSIEHNGRRIEVAGEFIELGSATLHAHPRYLIDQTDPGYDPAQTTWAGTFRLEDAQAALTGYQPSASFRLRFRPVACVPGDANGDGVVNFDDIDAFITVLIDPAGAAAAQRCAADVNIDGFANFDDIDAFIVALIGA